LAAADVVILPSRDEAMPTVTMLEAMSLGKAIISTTVGGSTEFLIDGRNALLIAPEKPVELAAAIEKLIESRSLLSELGEQARLTYEQHFTMERFGPEFCELIMEMLSRPNLPRVPALIKQ
jgi:glycosyltransferase involved in cell wall biosynthesis